MESVKDRAEGILLGLAAGDRNGGPIRMAVRLAESLADSGTVDVGDIAARYMEWWHHGAFDTGPVAARVFTLVDAGLSFGGAGFPVGGGVLILPLPPGRLRSRCRERR